jgi:hypothetical protein
MPAGIGERLSNVAARAPRKPAVPRPARRGVGVGGPMQASLSQGAQVRARVRLASNHRAALPPAPAP